MTDKDAQLKELERLARSGDRVGQDQRPPAVVALEQEPETIEVVPKREGVIVARVTWRDRVFEETLPKGFETWTVGEIQAHMRRFVAKSLKVRVAKAKWNEMAAMAEKPKLEIV